MPTNESQTQAHSPSSLQEDLGEWAWLHQTTTFDMPELPLLPPSPTYYAFSSESSQAAVPPFAPQTAPSYPAMNPDFTDSSLDLSPVEPLVQDLDPFMAFQLGLYLGSTDPSWAVPGESAPGDLVANNLGENLFTGLDFIPEAYTCTPPQGSTSPATPLYDMEAMYFANTAYPPADPLTPISLANGTPESALSPTSPTTTLSQTASCAKSSSTTNTNINNHPSPPYTNPSAATSPTTNAVNNNNNNNNSSSSSNSDGNAPQKPERKPPSHSNRRARFRCPVTPATAARCARGFADARTLHRHLWTHHKEYARAHAVPSEEARCPHPGCGYVGRADNVARHAKRHGGGS